MVFRSKMGKRVSIGTARALARLSIAMYRQVNVCLMKHKMVEIFWTVLQLFMALPDALRLKQTTATTRIVSNNYDPMLGVCHPNLAFTFKIDTQ